jgi:hypothetical protein
MTEILGSDDGPSDQGPSRRDRRDLDWAQAPANAPTVELIGEDDDAVGPAPSTTGRLRLLVADLLEPAALAVASALSLVVAAAVGPSYRFDAYPFSQGVSSLRSAFGGTLQVRPLHDYLTASAPAIVLVLAALLTSLSGLLRSREDEAGWVRPVAGGALIVAVLLAALLGLGAYRTSTYDLNVPQTTGTVTS